MRRLACFSCLAADLDCIILCRRRANGATTTVTCDRHVGGSVGITATVQLNNGSVSLGHAHSWTALMANPFASFKKVNPDLDT